jgi:hypothetical protein
MVGVAAGIAGLTTTHGGEAAQPVGAPELEDLGRRSQTVPLRTATTLAVGTDRHYADPYNDVDLDFLVTAPDGIRFALPAYVVRDGLWACNFAGSQLGEYTLETRCSVSDDLKLHGQKFAVRVTAYTGANPLYRRGRLRAAADKHHLEHSDGTPFLWIGDTWWMALSDRIDDSGFARLVKDRADKGFSLIQIIAGPYPEMFGEGPDFAQYDAWDPRGRSAQGFPFEKDFARVNAAYYNAATARIEKIIDGGLVPCIVGMWGFYLPHIGVEKVKRFWRNLVARYAAYPVVWCIAGEALMLGHFSDEPKTQDFLGEKSPEMVARSAAQKKGWTEVMRHVREIDPYHNPITVHPTEFGHDQVEDASLMDVDMLQTGHSGIYTIPHVVKDIREALAHEPKMPVVNGEVNYEGLAYRVWQDIIRLGFYHTMFNGAAGITYGANGIWQVNQEGKPERSFLSMGDTPWEEAMHFPGSLQVGLGAKFLARFPWWQLQRRPDWIDESKLPGDWFVEHIKENDPFTPVAIGIPRKLRIVYVPICGVTRPTLQGIEPDVRYTARYFDPVTGREIMIGPVNPGAEGKWVPPPPPTIHDWLIVLEA